MAAAHWIGTHFLDNHWYSNHWLGGDVAEAIVGSLCHNGFSIQPTLTGVMIITPKLQITVSGQPGLKYNLTVNCSE